MNLIKTMARERGPRALSRGEARYLRAHGAREPGVRGDVLGERRAVLLVRVLVRGLVAPGDELGEPIDELAALVGQARREFVVLGRIGRDVEATSGCRSSLLSLW